MKYVEAEKICDFIKREMNLCGDPFDDSVCGFGLKIMGYIAGLCTDVDRGEVFKELLSGEWVDSDRVQKAFGLDFNECLAIFDFSRTAEWWSMVGKTPEERSWNGQKIVTCFRIKGRDAESKRDDKEAGSDGEE